MPGHGRPPLEGVKVVELAGLAPVPYCGLLLADYGATVLRIDRAHPTAHSSGGDAAPRTNDTLTRNKRSIAVDLKRPRSKALLLSLLRTADVLIEPFRPGVLESLGLAPAELLARNPRLIVARLTGFRRDGKYAAMAGHDINYLAVSGVLSQLGSAEPAPPQPPVNILGDFAGGGMACAFGVMTALFARERTGKGQVVESNMVDAVQSLGAMTRLGRKTPMGDGPRGTNMLDGGAPFYGVYRTSDAKWMSVGALEPQFFDALAKGLGIDRKRWATERMDRDNWPELRRLLTEKFAAKTRKEWERIFDGTDACCAPVLEQAELEEAGEVMRAAVTLTGTPAAENVGEQSWQAKGLRIGEGGEEILGEWMGWKRGEHYDVEAGALVQATAAKL